jgi:hypothetical protein
MTLHDFEEEAQMARLGRVLERKDGAQLWRERERASRPAPADADITSTRGQLPTPFEASGITEPEWKLSGVLNETELQERQEQQMRRDEEEYFDWVSNLYQQELEENEVHHRELERLLEEEEEAEKQQVAREEAEHDEDSEALQDEIEALVRELRNQAQENGLRRVEAHIHKSHVTTIKNVKECEHEIDAIQEHFMSSVLEQQERILEEQENEKFETCFENYTTNIQLSLEGKDAFEFEADQNEQRVRRMIAEEQAHARSQTEEEMALERMAREQEEADHRANNADLVESSNDGKEAMRIFLKASKEKHENVQTELKERHDMFISKVNEQVLLLHVEAEKARRREWEKFCKAKKLSFRNSDDLLKKARDIVKNMDAHIERMDSEFQSIVERTDLWPPGQAYCQPHQRSKLRSAGATFDESIPSTDRPSTAPLRQRSAQRRDAIVRLGRSKAPTGFSYAIRIVFEHMDKQASFAGPKVLVLQVQKYKHLLEELGRAREIWTRMKCWKEFGCWGWILEICRSLRCSTK